MNEKQHHVFPISAASAETMKNKYNAIYSAKFSHKVVMFSQLGDFAPDSPWVKPMVPICLFCSNCMKFVL